MAVMHEAQGFDKKYEFKTGVSLFQEQIIKQIEEKK